MPPSGGVSLGQRKPRLKAVLQTSPSIEPLPEPERRRFAEDLTDSVPLLRCPEIIRVWAGTQVVLPLAHHQHTMAAIDAVVQRT